MTPEERKKFEDVPSPHLKYWIPMVWFSNLASKARQEGRIEDNVDLQSILHVSAFGSRPSLKHQMEKTGRKPEEQPAPTHSQRHLLLWRPTSRHKPRPLLPSSWLPASAGLISSSCVALVSHDQEAAFQRAGRGSYWQPQTKHEATTHPEDEPGSHVEPARLSPCLSSCLSYCLTSCLPACLTSCLPACLQEMNLFRTSCSTLFGYDWVGVPLVYTQASFSSISVKVSELLTVSAVTGGR